jgi:hypothetical protein
VHLELCRHARNWAAWGMYYVTAKAGSLGSEIQHTCPLQHPQLSQYVIASKHVGGDGACKAINAVLGCLGCCKSGLHLVQTTALEGPCHVMHILEYYMCPTDALSLESGGAVWHSTWVAIV